MPHIGGVNQWHPHHSRPIKLTCQGELRELWSASYGPDAPGCCECNSQRRRRLDRQRLAVYGQLLAVLVWRSSQFEVNGQHPQTCQTPRHAIWHALSGRWQRSRCGESTVQERLKRTAGVPMKWYCTLWCNDTPYQYHPIHRTSACSELYRYVIVTPDSQGAVWSSRMSLCPDSVLRSFAAWRLSESAPKMKKRRAHVSEEHRLGSRPMIQNPSRQKELVRKRRAHIASEKNYSDIYIYKIFLYLL